MSEISEKSKKNEILEAYYELLNKTQETKVTHHQEEKQRQINEDIVIKAAQFDTENIVTTLAQVKLSVSQNLSQLEKRLSEEYERLSDLQAAIKLETKNLEEVHEIRKNADSLAALLLAQKEYKARFEAEIEQKKSGLEREIEKKHEEWKLEQEQHQRESKEQELRSRKERAREEEEYRYATLLDRKKEQDSYEARKYGLEKDLAERKASFEKECAHREQILATGEAEYAQLKGRVDTFSKELEVSVKNAEKNTRDAVERDYKYKMELHAKEIDGERRLSQQMIASMQEKIKEQETMIRQLTQKLDGASQQLQSITLKALESAGSRSSVIDDVKKAQ